MIRTSFFALTMGLVASSASSMPLTPPNAVAHSDNVTNVKIVCEENGYCAQVGRRKPVAHWVYGEGNFSGPLPYTGPGSPRLHYGWWPYWWY